MFKKWKREIMCCTYAERGSLSIYSSICCCHCDERGLEFFLWALSTLDKRKQLINNSCECKCIVVMILPIDDRIFNTAKLERHFQWWENRTNKYNIHGMCKENIGILAFFFVIVNSLVTIAKHINFCYNFSVSSTYLLM